MKYAMTILTLVGLFLFAPARAQQSDNTRSYDGQNFRRDRGNFRDRTGNGGDYGGDRTSRRFDRNGNGGDTSRFDRRSYDRGYDRTRESSSASTPTPVTQGSTPAVAKVAQATTTVAEPEPEPIENVSTNAGPVDPRSINAFRIIMTRNIFDPNRYPGSSDPKGPPPSAPKRTDLMTLVGSISYEKGDYAFFDGSSSDFRKTVKPGDTIAGYKVANVGPDKVTLEADGKKIELPVGAQMKRREGEEWKVNSSVEPFGSMSSSGSSSSATNSSDSSSSSSSGGDMPDALKRLLEQRKNEK